MIPRPGIGSAEPIGGARRPTSSDRAERVGSVGAGGRRTSPRRGERE
ncbi:hypothetical protein [Halorubrum aethiopicum]|nr:hypothetical protein [Halorubrum aethiopicum]